jgi:hypothetical protein
VITLLWAGLADYMVSNNYDYLIGCASIGMADGGHNAANLFQQLGPEHMAPGRVPCFPSTGCPFERLANGQPALVPPLIKGYLRVGAWICGEPAWDPDFNTADLLLLLPMSRMNKRYMRHFLKARNRSRHESCRSGRLARRGHAAPISLRGPSGRLRVLMMSDVCHPRVNGVSTSIETFASALARLGVRVTLVAPEYPGANAFDTAAAACAEVAPALARGPLRSGRSADALAGPGRPRSPSRRRRL